MKKRSKKSKSPTRFAAKTAKSQKDAQRAATRAVTGATAPLIVSMPRLTPQWGTRGASFQLTEVPVASAITPEEYVQLIDSQGKIVNISIKKIEEKLTTIVQSIVNVADSAADAGKKIATKIGKAPFELDEITIGLSIKAEAGIVVVGVGGDASLELKFVRTKSSGGGAQT